MSRTKKASQDQLMQILNFMEENPHMSTEGIKPEFKKSWKQLADVLNAIKDGAIKSPEKWSKCWNDWKFFVRKKAHKNIEMIGAEARLLEFLQKYGKKGELSRMRTRKHKISKSPMQSDNEDTDSEMDEPIKTRSTTRKLTEFEPKDQGPLKSKTSKEQLGILLNFMESQRMLSKSMHKSVTNWQKFSNVLNKLDSGTVKSPEDWEKCWQDWQTWVRRKARRTPEDPTSHLSAMETRVWSLMIDFQPFEKGFIKKDPDFSPPYSPLQVVVDDPLIDDNINFESLNDNHDVLSNKNIEGNSDDELNETETVESLLRNEQRRLQIEEAKLRLKEKRVNLEERRLLVEERRNEILESIDEKLGKHVLRKALGGSLAEVQIRD